VVQEYICIFCGYFGWVVHIWVCIVIIMDRIILAPYGMKGERANYSYEYVKKPVHPLLLISLKAQRLLKKMSLVNYRARRLKKLSCINSMSFESL
jgi:hypothetical protein